MYALLEFETLAPDFTAGHCHGSAPLWDYDIVDEEPEARDARFETSLAACDTCPIKRECFAWAEQENLSGLWGGQVIVPKPNDGAYRRCENCKTPVHGRRRDNKAYDGQTILCRRCTVG